MNNIHFVGKCTSLKSISVREHASWELVYCTRGASHIRFSDNELSFREADVLVIPPHSPHDYISETDFDCYYLFMTEPLLNFARPTLLRDNQRGLLRNAFSAAFYHYSSADGRSCIPLSAYGDLLVYYITALYVVGNRAPVVEEIRSTILSNYTDCGFELDDYLHSLPFSYDYVRKLFKKELGVTPHKFLTDRRLLAAANRLASPLVDVSSIGDVARLCGFQEPLYFSRLFKKKYGLSPSQYRDALLTGTRIQADAEDGNPEIDKE